MSKLTMTTVGFELIAKKHCGKFFVEQNKYNVTAKQKFSDTLSEMTWIFFDIVLKIWTVSEKINTGYRYSCSSAMSHDIHKNVPKNTQLSKYCIGTMCNT